MYQKNEAISIKKAAILNATAKYSSLILQLIYNAILSRILSPEEFGIIAVINVFVIFFQLFSDMGLGIGVIQNKSLSDADVDDIYSISVYFGIAFAVLFVMCSYPISIIYGNNIFIPLGTMLAGAILFNTFNMIPNAIVLKRKLFFSIAVRTITVNIISFTMTILLAFKGLGVYALAANAVISAMGIFIWNEVAVKLSFRFHPSVESVKKIWGYSMFQLGAQTLNYFNRNLDNLLIGKFFSAAELGQYNKAYTLTMCPITYLPGVITPVLHPILSEHQNNKKYIFNVYTRLLKFLSLMGVFGSAFCFFAGKEIIYIAFGNQWEAAVLPFRILSLSLWMQILTNTVAPIYQSIGNTKLMLKATFVTTCIIVTSIIVGVLMGDINIVALSVTLGYIVNFFVSFYMMISVGMEESFLVFLKNYITDFIIFCVLMLAVLCFPFNIDNIFLCFVGKMTYLTVIYFLLLFITKQYLVFISVIKRE